LIFLTLDNGERRVDMVQLGLIPPFLNELFADIFG